jgi:hypothetical protein
LLDSFNDLENGGREILILKFLFASNFSKKMQSGRVEDEGLTRMILLHFEKQRAHFIFFIFKKDPWIEIKSKSISTNATNKRRESVPGKKNHHCLSLQGKSLKYSTFPREREGRVRVRAALTTKKRGMRMQ